MTFYVRTAGLRDLEAVSALLGETWHATYDGIYGAERVTEITGAWHTVDALKPRLGRLNAEFVVGDDGARIGGMAFAAATGPDGKTVVLHQLYVHPDCQGDGLGTAMLAEIIESFPQAERVRLEVEEANAPAIRFYRARGFAKTGSTANCGAADSGIPAAIYEKPLG